MPLHTCSSLCRRFSLTTEKQASMLFVHKRVIILFQFCSVPTTLLWSSLPSSSSSSVTLSCFSSSNRVAALPCDSNARHLTGGEPRPPVERRKAVRANSALLFSRCLSSSRVPNLDFSRGAPLLSFFFLLPQRKYFQTFVIPCTYG